LQQLLTEAGVSQRFDRTSEHVFEILLESDQIQQRSARLDVDKQIDIALWPRIAADGRSEDADSRRSGRVVGGLWRRRDWNGRQSR